MLDDYLKTNPGVKDLPQAGIEPQSTVRCHNHLATATHDGQNSWPNKKHRETE